jgi:1,5-anhydro-D-fructose reductase (1,5-anhydro-D-mannitol-forming)
MSKIRWGIIGIGNIVNGTMAPGMQNDPNSEIVAATSRDQGRADAFVAKFEAKYGYTDYDEMLANPEVDAVFIATPNSQHAEQVIAAAKAGKHVLCDKPMSISVKDAVREIEACRAAGVKLGINFHNRRLQWVNDSKALVAEGKLGDIQNLVVEASAGLRPPDDWRNSKELSGLGTTYSQGVHVFDFIRYILGSNPVEVSSVFNDDSGQYEIETQSMSTIRYDNGALVFANINQCVVFPKNDLAIYGTKGRIYGAGLTRSRLDGNLNVLLDGEETSTFYPQPSGEAHGRNVAAFTEAVLAGEEPNASGIDGLHSMVLVEAIAKSAAEGRTVKVDYSSIEELTGS